MTHAPSQRIGVAHARPISAFATSLALVTGWAQAGPSSISLPSERAFPESLSATLDGTLYVGNLAEGGVVRIRPNGTPHVWIKPAAFGSASILGVLADESHNTLWVCSDDLSDSGIKIAGAKSGSALIGFDLKTGAGKIRAEFPGEHNFCNDIAIDSAGSAYVTNSDAPQILRLPAGGTQLEIWFSDPSLQPAPDGTGLDGIAFGSDGNLYFNRYDAADLYRIDVTNAKAGKLTKLRASRQLVLADAMRPLRPNVFLLIEGGGRLDTMTVNGDTADIVTLKDGYDTPTGFATVGTTAWVSEGQLEYLFDPAKQGQKPHLPFHLFAVGLPK
jgi:sugar lactone lactonase YvrE